MAIESLRQLVDRPEWMADAACRDVHPTVFYPTSNDLVVIAKDHCRRCDVQAECLAYAIATGETHGIWGGLDESQRRQARRRLANLKAANE